MDSKNAELVTIILTTLNSERYLARSIESCLNQTYDHFELVVIDGGSHDRTLDIIGSYKDPRISLFHQGDNVGKLPGALNLGMAKSRGEFLTWTQDDSWYDKRAIETMLGYLTVNPDVDLVYTDYWEMDADGERLRYQRVNKPERVLEEDVVGQCFLFRRSVYDIIGAQNTDYFPVHEVPWRVRVAERFKVRPLHVPLLKYSVHNDSLTARFGSWTLQRMMAKALMMEQQISRSDYQRRVARIDIDEAYDNYVLQGNFGAFWQCLVRGLLRNPTYLTDRGLVRLMLMSLTPWRGQSRMTMYKAWQERDAMKQQEFIAQIDNV